MNNEIMIQLRPASTVGFERLKNADLIRRVQRTRGFASLLGNRVVWGNTRAFVEVTSLRDRLLDEMDDLVETVLDEMDNLLEPIPPVLDDREDPDERERRDAYL